MNPAFLKKQRADLVAQAKAITTSAEEAGEGLTDEQLASVNAMTADIKRLDAQIASVEELAELERTAPAAEVVAVVPEAPAEIPKVTGGHVRADEDDNRGFKTPRDFMMSVMRAGQGYRADERLLPLRKITEAAEGRPGLQAAAGSDEQSVGSNPYGGFAVPTGFSPQMLRVSPEGDPAAGTRRIPMGSPTVKIPARTDKNHTTSVSGGLTVSRRAETSAASSSRMEMELIALESNMLIGLAYVTEELLTDSPMSFAALIQAGFADEIGSSILNEKLNGSGVGEYLGVNNSAAKVTVAKEGAQTADTIVGNNIVKMRAQCWGYGGAVWLANHDCGPTLAGAHIAGTNGDVAIYQPSLQEGRPSTLYGRPIFFSEYLETVGDLGDILLVNWGEFLEGILENPQTAESMHVRFANHERTFKVWTRNAGAPWWKSPITPKKGASQLSPIVALAARA